MERDDIGMGQAGHHIGFSVEVLLDILVVDLVQLDDLDGNFLPDGQVFGEHNFAEGTFSQTFMEQFVIPNLRHLSIFGYFLNLEGIKFIK